MAGYKGWSMSNNAVEAYKNGEKPISKWKKTEIIEDIEKAIKDDQLILNCSLEKLKKAPAKAVFGLCLSYSSWHHTSNHYNKTDFYSIDFDSISEITDEQIDAEICFYRQLATDSKKSAEEKWKCAFLEWSGTRKHPKATEIVEVGTVKGDWFYRSNGGKKKTTSNGFKFVEKIQ